MGKSHPISSYTDLPPRCLINPVITAWIILISLTLLHHTHDEYRASYQPESVEGSLIMPALSFSRHLKHLMNAGKAAAAMR